MVRSSRHGISNTVFVVGLLVTCAQWCVGDHEVVVGNKDVEMGLCKEGTCSGELQEKADLEAVNLGGCDSKLECSREGSHPSTEASAEDSQIPCDENVRFNGSQNVLKTGFGDNSSEEVNYSDSEGQLDGAESPKADRQLSSQDYRDETGSTGNVDDSKTQFDDQKAKSNAVGDSEGEGGDGQVPEIVLGTLPSKLPQRNFASSLEGAKHLAANPGAKKVGAMLDEDSDTFMRNDCKDDKWVVLELSQVARVSRFELSQNELYSSRVKDFEVRGRQSHPRTDNVETSKGLNSTAWHLIGKFQAENTKGDQTFHIQQPMWVRYLFVRFLTHYGNEPVCAINGFAVFGRSAAEELEEQLAGVDMEVDLQKPIAADIVKADIERKEPDVIESIENIDQGREASDDKTKAQKSASVSDSILDVDDAILISNDKFKIQDDSLIHKLEAKKGKSVPFVNEKEFSPESVENLKQSWERSEETKNHIDAHQRMDGFQSHESLETGPTMIHIDFSEETGNGQEDGFNGNNKTTTVSKTNSAEGEVESAKLEQGEDSCNESSQDSKQFRHVELETDTILRNYIGNSNSSSKNASIHGLSQSDILEASTENSSQFDGATRKDLKENTQEHVNLQDKMQELPALGANFGGKSIYEILITELRSTKAQQKLTSKAVEALNRNVTLISTMLANLVIEQEIEDHILHNKIDEMVETKLQNWKKEINDLRAEIEKINRSYQAAFCAIAMLAGFTAFNHAALGNPPAWIRHLVLILAVLNGVAAFAIHLQEFHRGFIQKIGISTSFAL